MVARGLQELFKAVRAACSPRCWSRGVELQRAQAVVGVCSGDEVITVRVRAPGRPVAPTVTLYPDDAEWDCDCGSDEEVCDHVAAAVIGLRRAREQGQQLPASSRPTATLGYRFRVEGERLALERRLVCSDRDEQPLSGPLSAALARKDQGLGLTPTHADLSADRILDARRLRTLPADAVVALLPLLVDAQDVRLDGRPIAISPEPVLPRAVVTEAKPGYRLEIAADPTVMEVVVPGFALCASEAGAEQLAAAPSAGEAEGHAARPCLRPLGETELTGLRLERLPVVRSFGPDRVAELITEVLPSLGKRLSVDVKSKRLPRTSTREAPRVVVEVSQQGELLSALAVLVYGEPPCARVDGDRLFHLGGPIPVRDERAEERAVQRLRAELDLAPGRKAHFTGEEAVQMAARLRAWRGETRGRAHRDCYPEGSLAARVDLSQGELDLCFEISAGEQPSGEGVLGRADPQRVIEAWQRGEQWVPLMDGGWARLPTDWLDRYGHRVADLLAARGEGHELPRSAQPALLALCDELEHPRPPSLERLAPLIDGFETMPQAELPADLAATLRGYQRQGVDWLCFLRAAGLGAVLADDMGLGKTVQALCALGGRSLVVCPTSVVHNWADEIQRFRPGVRFSVYRGRGRQLEPEAELTLTSYAILRLDIELLARERWNVVVLDEAQAIKNPDSQVARAAYRLRAGCRIALSGTPVENRLEELWSLAHFTNPGVLGGRASFRDRYAQPIAAGQPEAAARLRRRIRPFVLRRLKRQVAMELPPRTEVVMHCELDEKERAVYEAVRLATRKQVLAQLESGGSVLGALEALLRLRQAACHCDLVPGQQGQGSAKVDRLLGALEQIVAAGHKALVFSQWTSLLDRVEPHLGAAALGFCRLDGSTRDRARVVQRFQDSAGPPVMLLSLKAGGTGLNLTAADHVFLLDPWWNPAVEEQAADRAHRIGQDRPVMVYRLVAKDTVEERILELQAKKKALADAALGEAERAAGLTREDLLALLQ